MNSWHWPEVETNEPSIDISEHKDELTVKTTLINLNIKIYTNILLILIVSSAAAVFDILLKRCSFLLHMVWNSIQR